MEFRILGPLEVWEAGQPVTVSGAKPRALLAILLIHANRVVSTDRLIDLLWGEAPPDTVANTLQSCVSKLRRNLEPGHVQGSPHQVVIAQPPGYLIRIDKDQLDLTKFERLVGEARQSMSAGELEAAAASLRAALALWRGPAFDNLADEPFAIAEANRLGEMRLRALEDRIEAELGLGRHADLVGELEALVAEHPLRERLRGQLMLALYRSGRQAEASEVFYTTRELLVDQAGLEPGPELQRLLKAILIQDPALEFKPRSGAPQHEGNLPLSLTSFIGRTDELAEITLLISQSRLLTLVGAGGVGKTRLAMEAGRRVGPEFGDGVWFVELAALADADLLSQTVAFTLELADPGDGSLAEALIDHLKPRRLLIMLDNCEHLIDASARLAKRLLESCPTLRIVATSREALGIDGEVVWRVPSLSMPDAERSPALEDPSHSEAVALFADRARVARGSFVLSGTNAALVLDICRRVDGIPLAIELAAARLSVLSLDQIAARLNDRFRLLREGSRTGSPRQRTLLAAMDWSYDLLPKPEQALLRRLSVFAGGFSLEAAEGICRGGSVEEVEVLDLVGRLVRKSLVLVQDRGGLTRYGLLETIRQYAEEKLVEAGEADDVRQRHTSWYLSLAERADPQLRTPNQLVVLEQLKLEHDNLRAALEWSAGRSDLETNLRLAGSMAWFWHLAGYITEGRGWLERALARSEALPPAVRARPLAWLSLFAADQGDNERAVALGDQSLAAHRQIGDAWGIGLVLVNLARVADNRDDYAQANRLAEESLSQFRSVGDTWGMFRSLHWLGVIAWSQGEYATAAMRQREGLEIARDRGTKREISLALLELAKIELSQGNVEVAVQMLQETLKLLEEVGSKAQLAMATYHLGVAERCRANLDLAEALQDKCLLVWRELGYKHQEADVLCELGIIAEQKGDIDRGTSMLRESLQQADELSERWLSAKCLEALAAVSLQQDDPRRAASLFGAADALRKEIGAPIEPFERDSRDQHLNDVQNRLSETAFTEAWQAGSAMTGQEITAFALAEARAPVESLASEPANR